MIKPYQPFTLRKKQTLSRRSSLIKSLFVWKAIFVIALCHSSWLSAQNYGEPVKILNGFKFVEGPVLDAKGNLFFTDIPVNLVYQYAPDGKVSTFLENTGGANGLAFDSQGRLVACAGGARHIFRLEADGTRTILADSYDGKKLNSPNDLWIDAGDGIYFTDPRYGGDKKIDQDGMHVYYISPEDQSCARVIDDLITPNGIIGTPDNKTLYVVDEPARQTYRYHIESPGKLAEKTLFCDTGVDGLALTEANELVITTDKAVVLCSADGKKLHTWPMAVNPTNVCYREGTLFITAQDGCVYRIDIQ
jgi:gluconolactonase